MGGDHAPEEIVKGALDAARQGLAAITLVGDKHRLDPLLQGVDLASLGVDVVHASEVIGMGEAPTTALRQKKDASITVALRLVKEGKADGVVAAGSTGAAMAGALMTLGRIPGIERPAIAAVMPTQTGPVILLDVGANVDSKPLYLQQFAIMGSVYCRAVFKVERPRVGLFNIGEEEGKGNDLAKEAYPMLKAVPGLNFVGNIEGRDLPRGAADVVVCDGFIGNGLLKMAEGMALLLMDMMKEEISRDWRGKAGAALMKPNLKALKRRLDYAEYGGAPLLGVNGVCIIGHGSSKALGIFHAVRVAKQCIEGRAIDTIRQELASSPAKQA
ncbi:MAG: Phosphate acyltransferase [Cyanobacteria bacterium RYN_339]|nr:Phosphate acyltransferase [Cyanobacteria bacterium RYN_339]